MGKITGLPESDGIDGTETVVAVKDGQTVQAMFKDFLATLRARAKANARRRAGRVAHQFVDRQGRTAAFLGRDAIFNFFGIRLFAGHRRATRYMAAFVDAAGKVGVAITRDARLFSAGLDIFRPADRRRRATRYVGGMGDSKGGMAVGVERDGRVDLRISDRGLARLADDFGLADGWRGTEQRAFVRVGRKFMRAMMTDSRGMIYDAVQRRDGRLATAIAATGVPEINPVVGQSNAGYGSGNADNLTPFQTTDSPNHILSLVQPDGSGLRADWYGDNVADLSVFTDLAPSRHYPNYALSPSVLQNQARVALDRAARRATPPLLSFASWRGSYPAGNFLPGAGFYLYERTMDALAQGKANFARYGMPGAICRNIFWIQGEAGPYPYADIFGDVIAAYVTGARAAMAQDFDPHFYFVQVNQQANLAATGVELDQRSVATARVGDGVTCIGPMYQCQLFDQGEGDIHADDIGRMMVAELRALATSVVERGGIFRPLGLTTSLTRTGAQIDVTYQNMPGAQLMVDTDHVPDPGTRGYRAYIAASGAPLTISAADIVGTDIVRLTLAADPGEPVRVDYARDTGATLSQWARGRGQIYVDSRVPSPFAEFGTPQTIRHYALRMRDVTPT